jgi:hypothetical protein
MEGLIKGLRAFCAFRPFLSVGENMELIKVQTHMCVHTFTSTQTFRGNIVQMAVVPSVLNAGDFQRQYDWDVEFVHSGVDRG